MTTKERALGRYFDIAPVLSVGDFSAGARTGNRVHMKNFTICTFVLYADAGTDGDDVDIDLQEHNAASGGTSQDLDIITQYFKKEETTLDNDEVWTRVTQSAGSEFTAPIAGSAETENLYVVEVRADQLSDGFEWLSVNTPDFGSAGTKFGGVLAILSGPFVMRKPENLAAPQ